MSGGGGWAESHVKILFFLLGSISKSAGSVDKCIHLQSPNRETLTFLGEAAQLAAHFDLMFELSSLVVELFW